MDADIQRKIDEAKAATAVAQVGLEERLFNEAFKRSAESPDSLIWHQGFEAGSIGYKKRDGSSEVKSVFWLEASVLGKRKLEGDISEIRLSPQDKGKVAGSIYRALKRAEDFSEDNSTRKLFLSEALEGMYLADLLDFKPLLEVLHAGVKSGRYTAYLVSDKLDKFGMIPDYYRGVRKDEEALAEILAARISPDKEERSAEQLFEEGYSQTRNQNRGGIWGDGFRSARIQYKEGEEGKHLWLGWKSASSFADKVKKGEVTEVVIPPRERGKLVSAVERSVERLVDKERRFGDGEFEKRLYIQEVVAGIYLLDRHDKTEMLGHEISYKGMEHISEIIRSNPRMAGFLETELKKYE